MLKWWPMTRYGEGQLDFPAALPAADGDRSGGAATGYEPGRSGRRGRKRGLIVRRGRLEAVLTITPDELASMVVNVAQNGWSFEECLELLGFTLPGGFVQDPKGGRRRKGQQPDIMEQMYEGFLRATREQVERNLSRRAPRMPTNRKPRPARTISKTAPTQDAEM